MTNTGCEQFAEVWSATSFYSTRQPWSHYYCCSLQWRSTQTWSSKFHTVNRMHPFACCWSWKFPSSFPWSCLDKAWINPITFNAFQVVMGRTGSVEVATTLRLDFADSYKAEWMDRPPNAFAVKCCFGWIIVAPSWPLLIAVLDYKLPMQLLEHLLIQASLATRKSVRYTTLLLVDTHLIILAMILVMRPGNLRSKVRWGIRYDDKATIKNTLF